MSQPIQANEYQHPHTDKEAYRKRWIEAVEQMAENKKLKKRIDFLEREIATNAFGGWQVH